MSYLILVETEEMSRLVGPSCFNGCFVTYPPLTACCLWSPAPSVDTIPPCEPFPLAAASETSYHLGDKLACWTERYLPERCSFQYLGWDLVGAARRDLMPGPVSLEERSISWMWLQCV